MILTDAEKAALLAGLERLKQRQTRAKKPLRPRKPLPPRKLIWVIYRDEERITVRYSLKGARACCTFLNRLVGQKVYSYQKEDVA